MAYSDFTLDSARRAFALIVEEQEDLFRGLPARDVDPGLQAALDDNAPLAISIHTEKARSELIVSPILLEIRRLMDRRIGFFSGITFDVAADRGLNGACDFILSKSPAQFVLSAPALTVVEAKNDNIKSGLGRCVAEMVAARLFNERERFGPTIIFGAVTTGSNWRFLKLEGDTVYLDHPEYYLDDLGKILAILLNCVGGPID